MIRVLIVNASDSKGGAAVVSRRLLHALNKQEGVEAKMLVAEKQTDDESIIALPRTWWIKKALDRAIVWAANGFSRKKLWLTDGGFFGNDITKRKEFLEADVIHLHWVNQGFLGLRDIEKVLRSGKKVVWTLHDMWPATAVCHIPGLCNNYIESNCNACPLLMQKLVSRTFEKKFSMYQHSEDLQFVAVSNAVKQSFDNSCLAKNTGLRCGVIGNLLPVENFNCTRSKASDNKVVMAIGAARLDDPVKGLPVLIAATKQLAKNPIYAEKLHLILYGGIANRSLLEQIALPYTYKGVVSQQEVAEIFRESDIVLSTSNYETFGATLAEGIACGCLAVTRGTGGQRDVVEHMKTGYIVEEGEDFSKGIAWAVDYLENAGCQEELRSMLHQMMVDKFSCDIIAKRHLEIYETPKTEQ